MDARFMGQGKVYVNKITMADSGARRFELSPKALADLTILVKGEAMLFGDSNTQTYPVSAGSVLGYSFVEISSLYFKNAVADRNATIHILGVEI